MNKKEIIFSAIVGTVTVIIIGLILYGSGVLK